MPKYIVSVIVTELGHNVVKIDAPNEKMAKEKALGEAADHAYLQTTADYKVIDIRFAKEDE